MQPESAPLFNVHEHPPFIVQCALFFFVTDRVAALRMGYKAAGFTCLKMISVKCNNNFRAVHLDERPRII